MLSSPNITLYAVGVSLDESESVQKAGCCITMECEDEHHRKSRRVITHPIGNGSHDRACLQAVHLALAAVIRPMRRTASVKLVCLEETKAILDESEVHPESPGDNLDVIQEILKWITFYAHLQLVSPPLADIPGIDRARECAESQSGSDTGTVAE